jgi:hypothetical protein
MCVCMCMQAYVYMCAHMCIRICIYVGFICVPDSSSYRLSHIALVTFICRRCKPTAVYCKVMMLQIPQSIEHKIAITCNLLTVFGTINSLNEGR